MSKAYQFNEIKPTAVCLPFKHSKLINGRNSLKPATLNSIFWLNNQLT